MAVATLDTAPADALPDALPLDAILCGDALEMLRTLPDNSVDSIVTDPPAGISFMGKGWDSNKGGRDAWIAWLAEILREAWRVTKPGGHALVWALPRTSHWTAMALEDAGFEVRDCVTHLFGSGFPKSHNISVAIDKAAKVSRPKVRPVAVPARNRDGTNALGGSWQDAPWETAPATDAARTWDGWGTALKPAAEFWWLCRKPLSERNVAANVLRWGTGALNIAASRVVTGDAVPMEHRHGGTTASTSYDMGRASQIGVNTTGRWPANLLLSHAPECDERGCSLWCPVRTLDAQVGTRYSRPSRVPGTPRQKRTNSNHRNTYGGFTNQTNITTTAYDDLGTPSRYFTTFAYVPKASRTERNRGCEVLPAVRANPYGEGREGVGKTGHYQNRQNTHPTVKPLALMTWLVRLITPPGGIVLDPFAGSGSTLCAAKAGGWRYIGIEREPEYVAIAQARVRAS